MTTTVAKPSKPFYTNLWIQVLFAITIAIAFGYLSPAKAIAMKPLGDGFIRLITMIITLIIFCTVVSGIASMQDMKKVGRVGGKALLYFEVVSTLALLIGLVVGNLVHPGTGLNVNAANLDAKAVADYAGAAKAQSVTEFLLHIIPTTVVDAFAKGDILQVVFIAVLFGLALSSLGERGKTLIAFVDAVTHAVFGVVSILMRFAPIGAFAWIAGFSIIKFLAYIKEEVILVLAISSSEPAIPTLMAKLEKLGCSKALVGLIVPTGYTFNTDGSAIYMTLAALF